jgi:hypothetical protein
MTILDLGFLGTLQQPSIVDAPRHPSAAYPRRGDIARLRRSDYDEIHHRLTGVTNPSGRMVYGAEPVTARVQQTKVAQIERFITLQKWEGLVIELKTGSFLARLTDLTNAFSIDEEGEFAFEDIDEADRPLLAVGAVFYWVIGYQDGPKGRSRVSRLRMKRAPLVSAKDLIRANEYIKALRDSGWR